MEKEIQLNGNGKRIGSALFQSDWQISYILLLICDELKKLGCAVVSLGGKQTEPLSGGVREIWIFLKYKFHKTL